MNKWSQGQRPGPPTSPLGALAIDRLITTIDIVLYSRVKSICISVVPFVHAPTHQPRVRPCVNDSSRSHSALGLCLQKRIVAKCPLERPQTLRRKSYSKNALGRLKWIIASILLGIFIGTFDVTAPLTRTAHADTPACPDGFQCRYAGCSNEGKCRYEDVYQNGQCPVVRCPTWGDEELETY